MPLILDTPFGFGIDLSFWQNFFALPPTQIAMGIFAMLLWWPLALWLFKIGAEKWAGHRQKKHIATWNWTVLAVDVPAAMVQSPKSVEQVFTHLSGGLMKIKLFDKYWTGKTQKWFSFEIISVEGYIQFLIRTEVEFRDLVEAAVYAQYAEAEITEVEDYATVLPEDFIAQGWSAAGAEFNLAENECYPIRTYQHFEYTISKDIIFSDPMAAILENFSRIGSGEYFWVQLVILPSDNSWKKAGIDLVKKIITNKKEVKGGWAQWIGDLPLLLVKTTIQAWNANWEEAGDKKKKEESGGKVSDLTPGTRAVVESIEEKISKIGFRSQLRSLYAAKNEIFNPQKCLYGFVGAVNQFFVASRNGLVAKPAEGEKLAVAFKNRSPKGAVDPYILNIEELATLWHFPLPSVKTPLVQKTELKRGEPPINLPIEKPLTVQPLEKEDLPFA